MGCASSSSHHRHSHSQRHRGSVTEKDNGSANENNNWFQSTNINQQPKRYSKKDNYHNVESNHKRTSVKNNASFTSVIIKDNGVGESEGNSATERYNANNVLSPLLYEDVIESLKPGELFEDAEFPASLSSLYNDPNNNNRVKNKIIWLRPKDIIGDKGTPQLVTDGVTKDDIKQGILGDCWFLSSCAAVSLREKVMSKVIAENQLLYGSDYHGIVRFQFWRYGKWVTVVVDDRLPTIKGKLIYAQSRDPNEFWVSLIEKAYAKVHGSYENLEGGITMDALVDLTGGLAERYELMQYNSSLYKQISRAHKTGAFITCSRKGDWRSSTKADANGLIPGHAYTVTDVAAIEHKMGTEKLLRVRNPWADATEWRGSWSDNDVNWEWVDEETKNAIQQNSKDDGEFWISFKDFFQQFVEVTICLMGPDFDGDGISDNVGHTEMLRGEWILDETAGGSRNNLANFQSNDQYLLDLFEADEFNIETDDADSEGKSNIVIALMQDHRYMQLNNKTKNHQIGFYIYKAVDSFKLPLQHFRFTPDVDKTQCFINYREVSARFELEPGQYVIIPTTYLENCPARFMLRVFGEKRFSLTGPLPSSVSEV